MGKSALIERSRALKVMLVWMLSHKDIASNEKAGELVRLEWTLPSHTHQKHHHGTVRTQTLVECVLQGLRQSKMLIAIASKAKANWHLQLNKDNFRKVVGLPTGHYRFRKGKAGWQKNHNAYLLGSLLLVCRNH